MAIIIYDALGYKSPERNNPRGTGEPIIHGLREKYPQSRELFDSILEHRGVKKLLSTYINKLPKEVKESTNKIHTQLKQYGGRDRKSTRLNSSHVSISYAVYCLKKKNRTGIINY